jgi:hypothetical protein
MSVEYALYAAGELLCVLAMLSGVALVIWKREPLELTASLLFPAVLLGMTQLMPGTTIFRALSCLGMVGLYWALKVIGHHDVIQRFMRGFGWGVAGIVILEVVIFRSRPAFLANPNMTASWLLLCWPWLPTPLVIVAILATQSRAAIAGLAIALAARWMSAHHVPMRLRTVALSSMALFVPWAAWLRWSTVADRIGTWLLAIRLFGERPWLGWGPGASALFGRDHMDSAPLTIAAEMGLVGLVAFTLLVVSIGITAWNSSSPAKWALLAIAIQNVADDTWLFPVAAMLIAADMAFLEDPAEPVKESIPVVSLGDWLGQKVAQLKRM